LRNVTRLSDVVASDLVRDIGTLDWRSPGSTVFGAAMPILIAVYGTNHPNGTAQVCRGKEILQGAKP